MIGFFRILAFTIWKYLVEELGRFSDLSRLKKMVGLLPFLILFVIACTNPEVSSGNTPGNPDTGIWDIPRDQVLEGGPGKDGIPALENPALSEGPSYTYLSDDDLVLGYKRG
jgi:hypothetical protein